MKLGYFTMPLHTPGSDMTKTLESDLKQLITLDKLGYSEAWIGEHLTAHWENIPVPELLIAQALGLTQNIVFGTGVTCLSSHNPLMVALRIAQLDHMAHGRFFWGIGSGSFVGDLEMFGFDPGGSDHRRMTLKALDLIIQLWNDPKPGRYTTEYWDFTIPDPIEEYGLRFHVKPYQLPHPPIGVAGISPRSDTLTLAGARGYMPMSVNLVPTNVLLSHWDSVENGARSTQRKTDRSKWRIAREIFVAKDTETARKEVLQGVIGRDFENYFLRMLGRQKRLDIMKIDPDMPDSEVTLEYLVDNIFIIGSPDDVSTKIRKLYEDVGGFGVLLAVGHDWMPEEAWLQSVNMLKDNVMPRLTDLV